MSRVLNESVRFRVKRSIRKQNLTRNPNPRFDTSDVAQEVSLQLWREIEANNLKDLFVSDAYLDTVTRGHVAKLRRFHLAAKRSMEKEAGAQDGFPSATRTPSTIVGRLDEVERAFRAIQKLSDSEKLIVKRRLFEESEFRAIADELGVSEQKTRRLYISAIAKIKKFLSSS